MSYYKKFRIVIGTPLWRIYLRWAYKTCISDFRKLNFVPNFSKQEFTCLLCGVGNEVTADEFIRFVLERNKNPHIWIIDLGNEQLSAVRHMIEKKYPSVNITIKEINALDLASIIKPNSIDWIETDGVFEFFHVASLKKLLIVWKELLSRNGFITTRACASRGKVDEFLDNMKVKTAREWLQVENFTHTEKLLDKLFTEAGFRYVDGPTVAPLYRRYSLIIE